MEGAAAGPSAVWLINPNVVHFLAARTPMRVADHRPAEDVADLHLRLASTANVLDLATGPKEAVERALEAGLVAGELDDAIDVKP